MLVQFDTTVLELKSMTNSASALHFALSRVSPRAPARRNPAVRRDLRGSERVLANETGRKAMVILSDGGDNGSQQPLPKPSSRRNARMCRFTPSFTACRRVLSGANTGRPPRSILAWKRWRNSPRAPVGMCLLFPRDEPAGDFTQIGDDLRLQYELGYSPPPDTHPNSYHKLELKAKDKKLTVQARKGFFQPG